LNRAAKATDRGSHAALMDKVYRRQRHFYDLTRKYYLLGRDRLVREMAAAPGQSIVEIGCGTARNLIRMAEAYPETKLYGLDASAQMLLTASEAVARDGFAARIALKQALAEELTPALFESAQLFDHTVFSYSLSMIPDWRGALLAAANATRPQGLVHIVDFGDLKKLWRPAAHGLRRWLRLFHVAPRDELLQQLEAAAKNQENYTLHILPGRYAFCLRASPVTIKQIVAP
jgi:S-adenosylmethionine-diacylgycerolhomoserine-N-methlytransferase